MTVIKKTVRYLCPYCGGGNILIRAWVNVNTLRYAGDCEEYDYDDGWFCNDCELYVKPDKIESKDED